MRNYAFLSAENRDEGFLGIDGLSADEEKELSKQILAGEAAKESLSNNADLSDTEKSALTDIIEAGARAYDRLVLANLPRAAKIAAETLR